MTESAIGALDLELSAEVAEALDAAQPLVALESTIFSELGLPHPSNRMALDRCRRAVIDAGAVPALTSILDGRASIGAADPEVICGPARKVATRDIGVAIGQRWAYGATTVSASLTLAALAGIEVFATGGIGGVHRDWSATGDISADLAALATHPLVTVSAGAKVFLDLAATLERLETDSVPVLGWRCDDFPAFQAASSGLPVPHRVDSAAEVAAIARAHWAVGGGGLLVVAPVPADDAVPLDRLIGGVDEALAATRAGGITGNAVTPAVLAALADATGGDSIPANLALAENNAAIAAAIAVALADFW